MSAATIAATPTARIPARRESHTLTVDLAGAPADVTLTRADGSARAAVYVQAAKHGSTVAGLAEAIATGVTLGLARGASLEEFAGALAAIGIEPADVAR